MLHTEKKNPDIRSQMGVKVIFDKLSLEKRSYLCPASLSL